MTRGVPAMDVMRPNAGELEFTSGASQFNVLNRLTASTRSATRRLAPSETSLDSAASTVQNRPSYGVAAVISQRAGHRQFERSRVQPVVQRPVAVRIGDHLVDPLISDPGDQRSNFGAVT